MKILNMVSIAVHTVKMLPCFVSEVSAMHSRDTTYIIYATSFDCGTLQLLTDGTTN